MASEVEICNLALFEIGQLPILSFTDTSKAAILSAAFYPHTRNTVLSSHPWNFALVRAQLARDSDTPVWGFQYQYQLPTDPLCLRVWRMNGEAEGVVWRVEGRKLLTDEPSAQVQYIAEITDSAAFSPLFLEALAARLSARFALPLTGSREKAKDSYALYDAKLREARSMDGQEGTPEAYTAPVLAEVR